MKNLEKTKTGSPTFERFSRRFQNGVEIIEHERHQSIKIMEDRYETDAVPSVTRLIISDAPTAAKLFIAKTRSEISGLDALLRNLTGLRLEPK